MSTETPQDERDELEELFELQYKADMRAVKLWQEQTGKKLIFPDRANMVVWLLEWMDRIREEARDACNSLNSSDPVKVLAAHLAIASIASPDMYPLGNGTWTKLEPRKAVP